MNYPQPGIFAAMAVNGLLTEEKKIKNNIQIAKWLMLGVAMIIIQIMLGGITRLTESGLSITEWKPITGVLPPIGDAAWQAEFDKYKNTDQFKYVHQHFTLSDFKSIFFWEWFHRLWGRLMGLVFVIGFIYFLATKKFSRKIILPMVVLFVLGGIQGAIGWIMVKSGLVPEKYFVGHVELTTHLTAAIILLAYTFWFAISLLPSMQKHTYIPKARNMVFLILVLLFAQLLFGGLMAGLRAGATAPTWPLINESYAPVGMWELQPTLNNIVNNPLMVHFIHRNLAYLLFFVGLFFFFSTPGLNREPMAKRFKYLFLSLLILQVVLGIITVLISPNKNSLVFWGVVHQMNAMFLVISLTGLLYLTGKPHDSNFTKG